MKSIHLLLYGLVSTMLLVSLPACTSKYTKGSVRFSAASADFGTQTRVSYGKDVNNSKFIKLNWDKGDQIRISSPQAYIEGATNEHAWTYTITDIYDGNVPQYSYGHLSPAGEGGLIWDENTPKVEHEFWALYPANGTDATLDASGHFTATIPNNITYPQYPDLWMVAHTLGAEGNEPGKTIKLYFYPAFTDVRLELNCAESIEETVTLQSCTLSTDNTFLSGTFDAQIRTNGESEGSGITFEPDKDKSYTEASTDCTGVSNGNGIPNGIIINRVGAESVSVDIICLPFETTEDIKLTCNFTIGTEKYSKSIKIPGSLFKPRRQNRLKGLVLPSDLKLIDFMVVSCGQHSDGQHHSLPDMTL